MEAAPVPGEGGGMARESPFPRGWIKDLGPWEICVAWRIPTPFEFPPRRTCGSVYSLDGSDLPLGMSRSSGEGSRPVIGQGEAEDQGRHAQHSWTYPCSRCRASSWYRWIWKDSPTQQRKLELDRTDRQLDRAQGSALACRNKGVQRPVFARNLLLVVGWTQV